MKTVPYQKCPLCNGTGRILAPALSSSCYDVCDVCMGVKIIPEYIITEVVKTEK